MKSPEEIFLDEFLRKINADLKEQRVRGRIDMVETGYIPVDEGYFEALRERAEMQPGGRFLKLTPLIEKAIRKAAELHAGQIRKHPGRKVPYVSHVLCVAEILARHTDDEAALVAAILHDTVEDTDYTAEDLARDFGTEVRDIVLAVSEDQEVARDRKASWEDRKKSYLARLSQGSEKALFVSSADKIHNLRSMIEAYRDAGEDLWANFNSPPDKKLWFYDEVFQIVSARLKNPIVTEFESELKKARTTFGLS